MDLDEVVERVRRLSMVDGDRAADPVSLESALVAARELAGWVEARQASLISRLSDSVSFPEAAIAAASKTSIGQAAKVRDRADTLAATPQLSGALDDGAITAGHVDVVTRSSKQLDETRRAVLFDRVDALVEVATAGSVEEFARRVRLEVNRIQFDDGLDRWSVRGAVRG